MGFAALNPSYQAERVAFRETNSRVYADTLIFVISAALGKVSTPQQASITRRIIGVGMMPSAKSVNLVSNCASVIGFSTLPMAWSMWRWSCRPSFSTMVMSTSAGSMPGVITGMTLLRKATMVGSVTARSLNCFSPPAPSTSATATA